MVNTIMPLYFDRKSVASNDELKEILCDLNQQNADKCANAFCRLSYKFLEKRDFFDVEFLLNVSNDVLKRIETIDDVHKKYRWKSSVCTAALYMKIYTNTFDGSFEQLLEQTTDPELVVKYPRALVNVTAANLLKIAHTINKGNLLHVNDLIESAFSTYKTAISNIDVDHGTYYKSISTEINNATNILHACFLLGFFSKFRFDYRDLNEESLKQQIKNSIYRPLAEITVHYFSLCAVLPRISTHLLD